MKKLIAVRFDDPQQAEEALTRIQAAADANTVALYDALIIAWTEGERRPRTRRPLYLTLAGKSLATLQHLALGMLYLLVTIGTAARLVAGHLLADGMDAGFVKAVRDQIAVDTSILVLLTDEKAGESVNTMLTDLRPQEIAANSFRRDET